MRFKACLHLCVKAMAEADFLGTRHLQNRSTSRQTPALISPEQHIQQQGDCLLIITVESKFC